MPPIHIQEVPVPQLPSPMPAAAAMDFSGYKTCAVLPAVKAQALQDTKLFWFRKIAVDFLSDPVSDSATNRQSNAPLRTNMRPLHRRNGSIGNLAAPVGLKPAAHLLRIVRSTEHDHHLGHGALGSDVTPADHAGLPEPFARFVHLHRNAAAQTLRDVQHHDAACDGCGHRIDEPVGRGGVARTVRFEYYPAQPRNAEHRRERLGAHAGEQPHHRDTRIEPRDDPQRPGIGGRPPDKGTVVMDADAHLGENRIVVGTERIELLGAVFGRAVRTEELV